MDRSLYMVGLVDLFPNDQYMGNIKRSAEGTKQIEVFMKNLLTRSLKKTFDEGLRD